MEFLKNVKRRRTLLSEITYVVLNICLALALMLIINTTGSLALAFGLVLLSQWRVLAVRVRYWNVNIQANLVSLIVSLSYVISLYNINYSGLQPVRVSLIQLFFAATYCIWLLFIRPKSKKFYIMLQANIALFFGTMSIFSMSYGWPSSVVIVLVWLVGYATSRHLLTSYSETHVTLLSLIWGFMMSQIGWLTYHWTIAYRFPIIESILIPQASIIMLLVGFLGYNLYNSYYENQKIKISDVILPAILTIALSMTLLIVFNSISIGA